MLPQSARVLPAAELATHSAKAGVFSDSDPLIPLLDSIRRASLTVV